VVVWLVADFEALSYRITQNYKRVVTLQISTNTAINYTTGYATFLFIMNYWVTPTGQVFQGETGGGSWHTRLCNSYLDKHEQIQERFLNWYDTGMGYTHDFFEQELRWVRYCDWGQIGWVISPERRLTKKQKEKIFELTGYVS